MKCLVIETSPERTNAHPVTDESGAAHVYATIKEARAELKANGYSYNRANDRYYLTDAPEYRAYVIREDSEEYAEIIEQAITEQIARQHVVKYISREEAEELHALRFEKALSWYELAQRYGITEHQARKAYSIIHYNKTRVFEYDTEAERATETAERTHAAEAIEDAREAWEGEAYYRIAYSDGGQDFTNDGATWYETAADLARDLRSAYKSATETHLPYAERIERKAYQRAELEAFLGEYAGDYDVDAIEDEATETDPKTGAQLWTPEAVRDLMSICERHELKD